MSGAVERHGVRDRVETEDDVSCPPLFKSMFICLFVQEPIGTLKSLSLLRVLILMGVDGRAGLSACVKRCLAPSS